MDRDRSLSPRVLELKQKRQKQALIKRGIFLILFLILIGVLVYILRLPKLQIININVTGNDLIKSTEVLDTVNNLFSKKYLFLIPKSNAFLYSKNEIEKNLRNKFPRIVDLSIDQEGLNTLNIKIRERSSTYLWCGHQVPEGEKLIDCYYVDSSGYIFAKAPIFTGPVYFVFYGTKNTQMGNDPIGKEIFNKDEFLNIVRFIEVVNKKLTAYALAFYDTNIYTVLLSDKYDDTKQKIVFNNINTLSEISLNLLSALEAEPLKTNIVDRFDDLEYIDLRYEDKVYYKFKQDGLKN